MIVQYSVDIEIPDGTDVDMDMVWDEFSTDMEVNGCKVLGHDCTASWKNQDAYNKNIQN